MNNPLALAAATAGAMPPRPGLLDWVDFKWLMMATEGERIDVQRTQGDGRYALTCLERGMGSRNALLARCARRLHERLVAGRADQR